MAQEYEAVTTLLQVCGIDTKTTNKQEVFSKFSFLKSYFCGTFLRDVCYFFLLTSQKFFEIKYSCNNPSKSVQSQLYKPPQILQIQK